MDEERVHLDAERLFQGQLRERGGRMMGEVFTWGQAVAVKRPWWVSAVVEDPLLYSSGWVRVRVDHPDMLRVPDGRVVGGRMDVPPSMLLSLDQVVNPETLNRGLPPVDRAG